MRVNLGIFRCERGHYFKAPLLPDFSYGEFLLWSLNAEVVYLNALEDHRFAEFAELIRDNLPTATSAEVMSLQKRLFGQAACDPDCNGLPFDMHGGTLCPIDRLPPISWEVMTPACFTTVRDVTHYLWDDLDTEAKKLRVRKAILTTTPGEL